MYEARRLTEIIVLAQIGFELSEFTSEPLVLEFQFEESVQTVWSALYPSMSTADLG